MSKVFKRVVQKKYKTDFKREALVWEMRKRAKRRRNVQSELGEEDERKESF